MASLSAIRSGLQVRLATIAGLRALAVTPETTPPATGVAWPRYMGPVDGPYATFGGDSYDEFQIIVAIGAVTTGRSEDTLDGYRSRSGTASIQAAIEGDETLAGAVHFALFDGWEGATDTEDIGGTEYPAARCRVKVYH